MMKVCIVVFVALVLMGIFMLCMGEEEQETPNPPPKTTARPPKTAQPGNGSRRGTAPQHAAAQTRPKQPGPQQPRPQTAQPGGRSIAPSARPPAAQTRPQRPRYQTGQVVKLKTGGSLTVGPDGIWPDKFPCCPICRCRNHIGEKQHVFWRGGDSDGYYSCENGHRFKRNGWPL